jgi:uncharacterized protein YceH (UPF0502 family)
MDICLTPEEMRVLGCLLEKKMATPEYYPLSLNALLNACNQKVNRTPVVAYDEATVLQALEGLRGQQLLWINSSGRVVKYKEGLVERFDLAIDQAAALCILLLRGPQTVGEIRARTDRLHAFDDLEGVHNTLAGLAELELAEQCARQPGQKETRFRQCLGSDTDTSEPESMSGQVLLPSADQERLEHLEQAVATLTQELTDLQQAFAKFKEQFE